jgi:hypothetical protein
MGNVIPLGGDVHQQVQSLLPWYVNDTLSEDEAAAVEAHLAECAECRRDLVSEKALGGEVSLASMDLDQGWAAMRDRIEGRIHSAPKPSNLAPSDPASSNVVPLRRKPIFLRSIPLGWALGAQAAALVLVFGGVRLSHPAPDPVYHTLSSASLPATGNMIVIFRPDTTELALRNALLGSHASLVGGPTDSNAYVLNVDGAKRADALAALRANRQIVLAEPIDGPVHP